MPFTSLPYPALYCSTLHLQVLSSRDRRGLTPLHKAVGLNKKEAAEFLLAKVVQLPLDGASSSWPR